MTTAPGTQSAAERAFYAALQDLYLRAGKPSSRAVATAIGDISHTTVNSAIKGAKVPSWPITAKIVEHLGGDVERFRQLWVETQERVEPAPTAPRAEVSVFVSYARVDDEATHGRITQLIKDIANTYHSMTGQVVGVFKDVDSIAPGEDWRDRIRLGLSSSSILLAFVSPAYLRSAPCREELSEFFGFLNANSSVRLILPLLFASSDRIGRTFSDDNLWQRISNLNWVDASTLRSADIGSAIWIKNVELISDRIDEVLSAFAAVGEKQQQPDSPIPATEDEDGDWVLDRLGEAEGKMPQVQSDLESFAHLIEELGEQTRLASPAMERATSFGQKLAVSRNLAQALTPIANDMVATADRLVTGFGDWNYLVNHIFEAIKADLGAIEDADSVSFLSSIREMATSGVDSLGQVEQLNGSVSGVIGFSKALDIPLKAVQRACLRMADLRGLLLGWLNEIEALESAHSDLFISS
ncbi:toll/interleukin-1 receptor domain-containing protein [Micromonospora sp. WMMD975]|uniref:toll/interleukin-1 receptor domain-containing protein n=1 Tax=Micromonospora sp. WMMD975 TaxID=3016087 RepID=UPI00249A9C72|nr:toll/interleukin-1 receptor domain-containing protein [Micromonospora sp. WMMD975]WFE33314.1 toll/interleukin-1 receptor domain-containing protein [Micromonospora sp. WMMD975]